MSYELRFGFTGCPSARTLDAVSALARVLSEMHAPASDADVAAQGRGEAADPVGRLQLAFEGLERTLRVSPNETCTLSVDFKISGK